MSIRHSKLNETSDYELIFDLPLTENATELISGVTGVQNLTNPLTFSADGAYGYMYHNNIGQYWLIFNLANTEFARKMDTLTDIIITMDLKNATVPNHPGGVSCLLAIQNGNAYNSSQLITSSIAHVNNTVHKNITNRKVRTSDSISFYFHQHIDRDAMTYSVDAKLSDYNNYDTYTGKLSTALSSSYCYVSMCTQTYGNNCWYAGYIKNVKIYAK